MIDTLFPEPEADEQAEQRALVALSLIPGVGPGRIRALLARFGSAGRALYAPQRALLEVPGLGPQTADAIVANREATEVDGQFARAERSQATLLTAWSSAFPERLRQIYDPPAFLWVRGSIDTLSEPAVAIVGTRRATDYGKRVAHEFAYALARSGYTIVSGLAYGIDAAAHRGALEAGGLTIAVLGSGVDRVYPGAHRELAEAAIRSGAVVSEYPMGAAPDAPNFPRRNRIVSGLSLGALIVEAFDKGGALITSRIALEQNREVFAVPNSVYSKASEGCQRLIQQGYAKLVLTPEDIVEELGGSMTPTDRQAAEPAPPLELNDLERRLYDAIGAETVHIDALCERTGLDSSTALVYLLSLEFKGAVRQLAGKQFARA